MPDKGSTKSSAQRTAQGGDPTDVEAHTEQILAQLKTAGVRLTTPRRAVIEGLLLLDLHPSAEDLVVHVSANYPEIHRSTVYRTLDALSDAGVVDHVHLGHGGAAYFLVDSDERLYVVCSECDAIAQVELSIMDEPKQAILANTGFLIQPGHFAIPGLCAACSVS